MRTFTLFLVVGIVFLPIGVSVINEADGVRGPNWWLARVCLCLSHVACAAWQGPELAGGTFEPAAWAGQLMLASGREKQGSTMTACAPLR